MTLFIASRSSPTNCLAGKYRAKPGANHPLECVDCPAGSFGLRAGRTKPCTTCARGYFSLRSGASEPCEVCPGGWTQDSNASRARCETCEVGTFYNTHTRSCDGCPSGYFQDDKAASSCLSCPLGRYGPRGAATSAADCKSCPTILGVPRTTRSANSTDEKQCVPDMWRTAQECHHEKQFLNASASDTQKWRCETCPDGASCTGQTAWYNDTHNDIRALHGFWRVPWAKSRFKRCPFPADCLGAEPGVPLLLSASNRTSVFDEECLKGTEGVLCSICAPGHNRNTLTCEPCTSASVGLGVFLLVALFASTVALVICCQRRLSTSKHKRYSVLWNDVLRIGNVMVTFYQVNSSLPSVIDLQWPTNFVAFISMFNIVNIDVMRILGAECIGDFDFRTSFAIMLLLPLGIVVVALIDYKCERISLAKRMSNMSPEEQKELEAESLHLLFQLADRDNSGHIDPLELSRILKQLGWNTDLETAKGVMASTPGCRKASDGYFASLPEDAFVSSMVSG